MTTTSETGARGCQRCAGPLQAANMAICDPCFWSTKPSAPLGDVVERHQAKIDAVGFRTTEQCEQCGGLRRCVKFYPYLVWVCDHCEAEGS